MSQVVLNGVEMIKGCWLGGELLLLYDDDYVCVEIMIIMMGVWDLYNVLLHVKKKDWDWGKVVGGIVIE